MTEPPTLSYYKVQYLLHGTGAPHEVEFHISQLQRETIEMGPGGSPVQFPLSRYQDTWLISPEIHYKSFADVSVQAASHGGILPAK
jgi:hypothetical protein